MPPVKTHRRVENATPIADQLEAQKPPVGCSEGQWTQYVSNVRKAELLGVKNPLGGVPKTWILPTSTRGISRVVGV